MKNKKNRNAKNRNQKNQRQMRVKAIRTVSEQIDLVKEEGAHIELLGNRGMRSAQEIIKILNKKEHSVYAAKVILEFCKEAIEFSKVEELA